MVNTPKQTNNDGITKPASEALTPKVNKPETKTTTLPQTPVKS